MTAAEEVFVDEETLVKAAAAGVDEEVVHLPGVGNVKVRGLTRGEVLTLNKVAKDGADFDARMIAAGLVTPKLTVAKVAAMAKTGKAGLLQPVEDAILTLSGMGKAAEKDAMASFRDEPGT